MAFFCLSFTAASSFCCAPATVRLDLRQLTALDEAVHRGPDAGLDATFLVSLLQLVHGPCERLLCAGNGPRAGDGSIRLGLRELAASDEAGGA